MAEALPSDEQQLAQATKRAVQIAGGLKECEGVTGKSDTQISRCSSPNHPDSLTLRDALLIDGIGHGHAGHPAILRTYARLMGGVYVQLPTGPVDGTGITASLTEITIELGDVAAEVGAALRNDSAIDAKEAQRIIDELHDLDMRSAAMRLLLQRIVDEGKGN